MLHDIDEARKSSGAGDAIGRSAGSPAAEADLVFDFDGKESPDLGGLALLLTARQMADRDDRRVWVRALPFGTWEILHQMGLAHLFELFPNSPNSRESTN